MVGTPIESIKLYFDLANDGIDEDSDGFCFHTIIIEHDRGEWGNYVPLV